jgi:hypothetical protein
VSMTTVCPTLTGRQLSDTLLHLSANYPDQPRYGANLAKTHLRHHPLKTGALDPARSRTAKIIVDHFDLRPAERYQAIMAYCSALLSRLCKT